MNEINTVQLIIRKFLFAIKDLRKEDSAAGRWLDWLGDTLQYQDLMENMEPFGAEMLAEAKAFSMKKRLGGQLKAAKGSLIKEGNNTPTSEEIEERRIEMYGEEAVEITAAATHREAVGESTTGCNPLTADAHTREDWENVTDGSNSGTLESGTSANIYDQETDQVSTNEALDKPGAGEVTSESVSAKPSPALPVPIKTDPKPAKKAKAEQKPEETKYPHGEFENIMLTTKEYIQLTERLDNADALIDEADQYFEAQPDKKRKYKSHYAMLLNWDRRRKDFEKPKMVQRFKTIDDINQERIAKAKREIYEMFHPGESKAV